MKQYINDFTSTVQTYYRELKKYKPLRKEDEKELLKQAKYSIKAKNKILTSNLRFVFNVANQYKGYGVSMEDLISEGNIGLTKAIDRFDNTKDVKFISYAVWWIKQSMQEYIKKKQIIDKSEFEINPINNKDTEINIDEVSDEINVDNNEIIDEEHDFENDETKYKIINNLLNKLNSRGKFIIESYFGLNGHEQKNLDEIGKILNISKERVRQLKERNLRILRSELMLLDNFDNIFK